MMPVSLLLLTAASIAPLNGSDTNPGKVFPLFSDLPLVHGFRLSAVRSSHSPVEVGNIMAVDDSKTPQWRLAQWGTRFSLESHDMRMLDDGTRVLENDGKRVKVYSGGLEGNGILLEVRGIREYDGRLRQPGEAWPHLLLEQHLTPQPLKALRSLNFSVTFCVEHCKAIPDKPLDPGLHTAHITAFWTIHNINPDSDDHNDMIWFGLPLFDARHSVPPGHQAVDRGQEDATGKFICTIAGDRLYDAPIVIGEWQTLACDMLPLLREALAAAQAQDFLSNTRFEDLAATSFNLGWEVPGPYDCAITVRDLTLHGRER